MRLTDYCRRISDMLYFHIIKGPLIVDDDSSKLHSYYSELNPLPREMAHHKRIIFMVDGRTQSGGLCDRFRGLISTYKWAKKHGYEFKIYYVNPIRLEDYLLPNQYDWRIPEEEISYNSKYSKPIHVHHESNNFEQCFFNRMLSKQIDGKHQQYHIYSNLLAVNKQYFSKSFNKLFQPSYDLQRNISSHIEAIGGEYVACSFRFLQLLGDFQDCVGVPLQNNERQVLINKCILQLERIHSHYYDKKLLVVSDSKTFIQAADRLDYVYTIPGRIVHMDYSDDNTYSLHLKTFVDFFMISEASRVYLLASDGMYPESAFAKFASWIGNKPFNIIHF